MATEFIEYGIWQHLTRAAKASGPSSVAVAYFGEDGAALLPLKKGSRLVVDASQATVKSGATCPAALLRLQKKGVRVFSHEALHAKVYVFGRAAFVGSANASRNSQTLKEGLLRTTDPEAIAATRAFVDNLCLKELGPAALAKLQKSYRTPKFRGGGGRRSKTGPFGVLRLAHTLWKDPPKGSESANREGQVRAKAKRKYRNQSHALTDFNWPQESFRVGESVVEVTTEDDGRVMVSPPAEVLYTKRWSGREEHCVFVYLEVPRRRRKSLAEVARLLGRGSLKRLRRSGRVSRAFGDKLRGAFSPSPRRSK